MRFGLRTLTGAFCGPSNWERSRSSIALRLAANFASVHNVEIAACIDQCDRPIPHKRLEDAQSQLSRC
jgi:hypothetical protein